MRQLVWRTRKVHGIQSPQSIDNLKKLLENSTLREKYSEGGNFFFQKIERLQTGEQYVIFGLNPKKVSTIW
jgi:hypothetical protein